MGEKMGPDGAVTHGICIPCLQKEERKMDKPDIRRWCKNCGEKVAFDAPPEQVWCDHCVAIEDQKDMEEPPGAGEVDYNYDGPHERAFRQEQSKRMK
jgi:hypothetical protein